MRRPGAQAWARLFFAAPLWAGGRSGGAGHTPAPLSGGGGPFPLPRGGCRAAASPLSFRAAACLSPRKLHPLLEEKDLKNDRPNNYFFWTFATHMAQMPPKKYNFTQFAAFFHFLLIKINYYFV